MALLDVLLTALQMSSLYVFSTVCIALLDVFLSGRPTTFDVCLTDRLPLPDVVTQLPCLYNGSVVSYLLDILSYIILPLLLEQSSIIIDD